VNGEGLLEFGETFEVEFFDPGDAIGFGEVGGFGDDFDLVTIGDEDAGLGGAEIDRWESGDGGGGTLEFGGGAGEALGVGHSEHGDVFAVFVEFCFSEAFFLLGIDAIVSCLGFGEEFVEFAALGCGFRNGRWGLPLGAFLLRLGKLGGRLRLTARNYKGEAEEDRQDPLTPVKAFHSLYSPRFKADLDRV
jgi:hypothetical protein